MFNDRYLLLLFSLSLSFFTYVTCLSILSQVGQSGLQIILDKGTQRVIWVFGGNFPFSCKDKHLPVYIVKVGSDDDPVVYKHRGQDMNRVPAANTSR